jgi:hypothetical protein
LSWKNLCRVCLIGTRTYLCYRISELYDWISLFIFTLESVSLWQMAHNETQNCVLSIWISSAMILDDSLPLLSLITFIVSSKVYILTFGESEAMTCEEKKTTLKQSSICKIRLQFYWPVITFLAIIWNRWSEAKSVSSTF